MTGENVEKRYRPLNYLALAGDIVFALHEEGSSPYLLENWDSNHDTEALAKILERLLKRTAFDVVFREE